MIEVDLDRRVKRTRRLLRDAVLEIAESEDLAAITVHDITRVADVNRATFYQHYRDKDDLIEQTIDALLEELFASCAPVQAGIDLLSPDEVHPSVAGMFRHVGEREQLYRRLVCNGGSPYFVRRFQLRNEELMLRIRPFSDRADLPGEPPGAVRARIGSAATLALFDVWLEGGRRESAETMAAWLWRLLRSDLFD